MAWPATMGGARVICAACLGGPVGILPSAKDVVGVFPFADVFRGPIHRKWSYLSDVMFDHRVGSEFFTIVSVPVHDLFEWPSITPADILFRIADRNGPDRTEEWRISEHGSKLLIGLVLAAARQPRGRQAASGDGELNVLDRRPKRGEKDTFVVLAVFLLPFRARSLRETALEARITQHDKDRNRVGKVGFLHGGETLGVIDEPLRLSQGHINHLLLCGG